MSPDNKLPAINEKPSALSAMVADDGAFTRLVESALELHHAGKLDEAAVAYNKAAALEPSHPTPYTNIGAIFLSSGKYADAERMFRQAIVCQPDMAIAHANLGATLLGLDRGEEAVEALLQSVTLQPDSAVNWSNLSSAYLQLERMPEAAEAARRAVALDPNQVKAHSNLGSALYGLELFEESIAVLRNALRLRDMPEVHKNLALTLLHTGQFAEGWREYDHRWAADRLEPRNYPKPLWNGEPVAGKTILLYAEQGLGDAMQFARFVPLLAAQGAKVVLEVHPALVRLMRTLKDVSAVIPLWGKTPDYDTYQALMSVPRALGIMPTTIPANVPYLAAEPDRVAHWRDRLGRDGFKVGVLWQGKGETARQRKRTAPVSVLGPLAKINGVRLISLQKDLPPACDFPIESLGSDFDSGRDAFLDSAAVIENLDLVITIDSAMAHLAGALGRPVWVAVKTAPDWRWMADREDSPWYPTARLFRQSRAGEWTDVFARMADCLRERLNQPPTTTPGRDFRRMDRFIESLVGDVYAETPSEPHLSITRSTIEALHREGALRAGMRVLDVGCGQGLALEHFRALGLDATGVTLGPDVAVCRAKGFAVFEMDQNFMTFPDHAFDVLWCRHVLEHSIAPLFTLSEYRRLTKPGGLVYVEVPAPDTSAHHEANANHYSVLTASSWLHLFAKAGFTVENSAAINFTVGCGPDTYWSFRLRCS